MKKRDSDKLLASAFADRMLEKIYALTISITALETEANKELAEVTARYDEKLRPLKEDLQEADKQLVQCMKGNRKIFFEESARLRNPAGRRRGTCGRRKNA